MNQKSLVNIETKIVENVIVLDDGVEYAAPSGFELIEQSGGNIGDTWDGAVFIRPKEPEEISIDDPGSVPNVIG